MAEAVKTIVAEETPTGWFVDHPFGRDGPLPETMARSRARAYTLKYNARLEIARLPITHPARTLQAAAVVSDGGYPGGES